MTLASRYRYWLPLLPLLGLLAFTYWLNQLAQTEPRKADSEERHDPDAIVESFSAVTLNAQGTPHFIVAARRMLHYPDDDSTTLEMPHLISLSTGNPALHAIAKRGIISSKGEEISLLDGVEVLREASASQNELRIHTEYLHFVPDREFASTNRTVTITEANNTIQATGLEMDYRARTLKLLARVRSDHVPRKR